MTDLVCRALLGDAQTQKKCTAQGMPLSEPPEEGKLKTKEHVTLEEYSKAYHEYLELCEADAKRVLEIIDGTWVRDAPTFRTFNVELSLIDAIDEIVELKHRVDVLVDRLAAYEDTGLEPEDFKKVFNEDAVLNLAGQVLGVTPDRLRELAGWHGSEG